VFILTTREGYKYTIDQKLGVTNMSDPNGNTLTISSSGIVSSTAQQLGIQNPERVCGGAGGRLLHSCARGKGFRRHPLPLALPHPGSNRTGSNN